MIMKLEVEAIEQHSLELYERIRGMAMNLQQERIDALCAELGFKGLPNHYTHLCQAAAKEE